MKRVFHHSYLLYFFSFGELGQGAPMLKMKKNNNPTFTICGKRYYRHWQAPETVTLLQVSGAYYREESIIIPRHSDKLCLYIRDYTVEVFYIESETIFFFRPTQDYKVACRYWNFQELFIRHGDKEGKKDRKMGKGQ